MKRIIFSSLVTILLLIVPAVGAVSALSSPENYTPDYPSVNGTNGKALKPSDIAAMYPMSAAAEAVLVHFVPSCPVNVDGVWYKAEEITVFNGQRLHFTVDKSGSLFAFTKAKNLEAFLETEYGPVFGLVSAENSDLFLIEKSEMFEDWMSSGQLLPVQPHEMMPDLVLFGWNDRISSANIGASAPVTLWEHIGFQGSSFTMVPGSVHSVLAFESWNDRASSIS